MLYFGKKSLLKVTVDAHDSVKNEFGFAWKSFTVCIQIETGLYF
tara:strand:- start:606 stop:737 length:132 start_codon:yes stop_codon:yes gene_type:complete